MAKMDLPVNMTVLALSVIGLGSLAYFFLYKNKEDDDYVETNSSARVLEISVEIPKDSVGMVIGRNGSNLKEMEATYHCKFSFCEDRYSDNKICRIKGEVFAAKAAEAAIRDIIANQPLIDTFEMTIPEKACGGIIGKGGITIRNISLNSNAKLTIFRSSQHNQRQITITGTSDQITAARMLLKQKLIEVQELESYVEQIVSTRSPRHTPKYLLAGPAHNENSNIPPNEKLVSTGSDGFLEVFVSALESPDRMWLQMRGPSTVELDRLNDVMTAYYSKPESCVINALSDVRVGQLVAAPFMYDNKYYRAEVNEVMKTADGGIVLDLYYVDYGDSGDCSIEAAFQIVPDFLKLRFQAIECILARVKPRGEEGWSEEACDALEDMAHVARWKPLTAHIHSYRERPTRARRQGSPVPVVDLFDITTPTNIIDAAEMLVEKGFARWDDELEKTVGADQEPPKVPTTTSQAQ